MPQNERGPIIVAVAGGKRDPRAGLVAVDLAVAAASLGTRVALIDADAGGATLHRFFGRAAPQRGIGDFLDGRVERLGDAASSTRVSRLSLVSGFDSRALAEGNDRNDRAKILRGVRALDAELVVIDVGSGSAVQTVDLFALADVRWLAVTPGVEALQGAYGLAKATITRIIRSLSTAPWIAADTRLFLAGFNGERVSDFLNKLRQIDVNVANGLTHEIAAFGGGIIGYHVEGDKQMGSFYGFSRMLRDFLEIDVPVLGVLHAAAPSVGSGVRARPSTLETRIDVRSRTFINMAERVMALDVEALRMARSYDPLHDPSCLASERAPTEHISGVEALSAPLPGSVERYQRESERYSVEWEVGLSIGGRVEVATALVDISKGGALARFSAAATEGEQAVLTMTIDGVPTEICAEVRRVDVTRGAVGLLFADEHAALAERLVAMARAEAARRKENAELRAASGS